MESFNLQLHRIHFYSQTKRIQRYIMNDCLSIIVFAGPVEAEHVRGCDDLEISLPGRPEKAEELQQAGLGDPERVLLLSPLQPLSLRGGQGGTR